MELGHPSRKNSALLENMVLNEAQASMSEQHQAWLRRPKSGTSSRSETPIQATSSMNDLTRPTRSAGNRSKRTVRTLSKAASIDSLDYSNSDFELNRPTNGRFYDYPESPSKNHTYDTPTGSPMKAKKVVAFADVEEPSVSHEVERYVPINSQQLVSLSQQSQPNGDGLPPIHQMMQVERPLALRNHIQMNVSSNLPAITNGTSSLNKIQLSLPPPPPSHDDHEGEGGEKYNNNPRALTHSSEGTMVQTNHLVPINGRIPSNGKRSNNGGTLVQTEGGMIKVALYGEFPVTQMK
ncbi:uncharacterized protein LOC131890264 isoform X1 [Tigriopus californicus]|uniref:uncharacterized protein LOC131890264 isoform X1 n=1 Tax=Tigriopus californicus TaxID=6832 RepID=UPI0027DA45DD|nr:uncharacterized protein LOC131890264 isoform X1 [Tigriopus californicus]